MVGLLAFGQQKPHWTALTVANRMQLTVQPTLGTADKTGNIPPFNRLQAVRCAFRWVASIISRPGGPFFATKAANIRSNTPIFDHRMNLLYKVLCGP